MNAEKIAPQPRISRDEFITRSGVESDADGLRGEALRLFDACEALVRPKALWRECEIWVVDDDEVWLDQQRFRSSCLAANLHDKERLVAYVATCGTELDDLASDSYGPQSRWIDVVKDLALEQAIGDLEHVATERLGCQGVAAMNPGVADGDVWPLEQQRELFRLLGDTVNEIGVLLTERCVMIPNKSLSGVLFSSDANWGICRFCSNRGCRLRRAAYEKRG